MRGKINPHKFLQKEGHAKLRINQFDDFWEIECPDCGRKIDLEVLVNFFEKKGGKK